MSFFWIRGCQPCMITVDLRYIVIFEVQTNVPVYAPCFEKLKNTFLGTFTLTDNAFAQRCGLEVDASGYVYSTLLLSGFEKNSKQQSKFEGTGMAPTAVKASTQTEAEYPLLGII